MQQLKDTTLKLWDGYASSQAGTSGLLRTCHMCLLNVWIASLHRLELLLANILPKNKGRHCLGLSIHPTYSKVLLGSWIINPQPEPGPGTPALSGTQWGAGGKPCCAYGNIGFQPCGSSDGQWMLWSKDVHNAIKWWDQQLQCLVVLDFIYLMSRLYSIFATMLALENNREITASTSALVSWKGKHPQPTATSKAAKTTGTQRKVEKATPRRNRRNRNITTTTKNNQQQEHDSV